MSEYNAYNQPQYQGQQSTGASSYEEAVSVKEWLLTYLPYHVDSLCEHNHGICLGL